MTADARVVKGHLGRMAPACPHVKKFHRRRGDCRIVLRMKIHQLLALLVTTGLVSGNARTEIAQSAPPEAADFLGSVRAAVPPLANLSYEWHDSKDFENGGGSAEFGVIEARAPFFFREFGGNTRVAMGLDYSLTDLQVENDDYSWEGQLHGLYLPISFTHRPEGSKWFWIGQVAPGLRTDFESIDSDDFAFRTFAVAMRQFGDELALGFGAFFSYDVDRIFAVPGIGFTWRPDDEWLISLIPPELSASWIPNDRWIVSATFRPRSFLADIDEGEDGPDIAEVSYGRLGLSVRHKLLDSPDIWLNLQAGYTLYSEVELQQDGRSLFDTDLDNGFYAGAAVELHGW